MNKDEITIEKFLLDRLGEAAAKAAALPETTRQHFLPMIENQAFIVKWHQNWPVLVEQPPVIKVKSDAWSPNDMQFSMTQHMKWMTQKEYVRVFDSQPPTAPLLRQIAAAYSWHPDYNTDWEI